LEADQELRERIAQVVAQADRLEAKREREKADAEERAIASLEPRRRSEVVAIGQVADYVVPQSLGCFSSVEGV